MKVGTNLQTLQKLKVVDAKYPPISSWKTGVSGQFSAVDGLGNVHVVTISYRPDGTMRRTTRLLVDRETVKASLPKAPGERMSADEGWNLPPEGPRSPVIERSRGGAWYDKD